MGRDVEQIKAGVGSHLELSEEERAALDMLRSNADQASRLVNSLTAVVAERVASGRISNSDLPGMLRAASDAGAKSIEGIAKLTGRDQAPRENNLGSTLESLAERGLLKMTVEIGPTGADE
jgi:hypothetical protein